MQFPRTLIPAATGVAERPRVLLADNHPQVLEIVARLLASDFDIVGAVADGRQALDLSVRLNPDVAVLDIGMPELDGFQTLQELRRVCSRVKVVLLTMYESDVYIAAAINSGAQGYVLKSGIYSNLISAIDHALGGRVFVPSITSLSSFGNGQGHAVHFHGKNGYVLDEVSRFVGGILRSGELIVAAVTEETRTGLARRLKEDRIDLDAKMSQGQYVVFDAAESVAKFMRNGRPDADLVAGSAADLDRLRISARGPESRLTLFGEMAVILCRDGNYEAVAELENMWNDATRHLPIFTICSYPGECFQDPKSYEAFSKVCAAHYAVTHTFNN